MLTDVVILDELLDVLVACRAGEWVGGEQPPTVPAGAAGPSALRHAACPGYEHHPIIE